MIGLRNILLILFCGIYLFACDTFSNDPMPYEEALDKLDDVAADIDYSKNLAKKRIRLENSPKESGIAAILPDIDQFSLTVDPVSGADDIVVEIFASSEKSGEGVDGWLVEMGNKFNDSQVKIPGGKTGKVKVRKISSGTGYQFIAFKKYMPDAYSPSHGLWSNMIASLGIPVTLVEPKLAGDFGGIVIKDDTYQELKTKYGNVDIKSIVDATIRGDIATGYTDPFVSSTGLNFLVSVLFNFADGDETKMLSDEVVSSFRSFQSGVPFVAMTTLQMRDSVLNDGSLDVFVMETKTMNSSKMNSDYQFIPFGVPHNNPLYAIGNLSREKMAVLKAFADFAKKDSSQKIASEYGFNASVVTTPLAIDKLSGETLIRAQKLWKEEKDTGKPIAAVFLTDTSGSMIGKRIKSLKKALKLGVEFIAPQHSIGLVTFSTDVNVLVKIEQVNSLHKNLFKTSVSGLVPMGNTAMYDGIAVSLKMLTDFKKTHPDHRLMLFVLSDGETNQGIIFSDLKEIIAGLRIPIYTIGYEANMKELKKLSSLVEAASLNAVAEDIPYQIGLMLNAEL